MYLGLLDGTAPTLRRRGRLRIPARVLKKLSKVLARFLGAHQSFADKKRLVAEGMQLPDLSSRGDPALGDAQHMIGNERAQLHYGVQVKLKRPQIAAVHADDVGAAFHGALQLVLVVDFAQDV